MDAHAPATHPHAQTQRHPAFFCHHHAHARTVLHSHTTLHADAHPEQYAPAELDAFPAGKQHPHGHLDAHLAHAHFHPYSHPAQRHASPADCHADLHPHPADAYSFCDAQHYTELHLHALSGYFLAAGGTLSFLNLLFISFNRVCLNE